MRAREDEVVQSSSSAGPSDCDEIIALNVGGQPFKFRVQTLRTRFPDALLANFARADHRARLALCAAYLQVESAYFFERSARLFESVYRLYVNGADGAAAGAAPRFCCRDADICEAELRAELQYWQIPAPPDDTCRSCAAARSRSIQIAATAAAAQIPRKVSAFGHPKLGGELSNASSTAGARHGGAPETRRERIFRFCEGDGTLASMLFITVSISFVIASVVGLVLGSVQDLQVPYRVPSKRGATHLLNETAASEDLEGSGNGSGEADESSTVVIWEPLPIFSYLETTCIVWFTVEYFLRLAVAPRRLQFMCHLVNVVDLIAILPFNLEMLLALCGFDVTRLSEIKGAFLVVRILRVLRVVRILKLGRYSSGMRTFALTLRSSARQLGMMGMVLFTGVVFFSTLLYYVEKDEPETPFTSIPAAFWWAIVTMSTVGYGDYVPATIPGKLIASGAILSGVLVLALPITIIVDNFMKVSGSFSGNPFASPMIALPYDDDGGSHAVDGRTPVDQHNLLPNGGSIRSRKREPC